MSIPNHSQRNDKKTGNSIRKLTFVTYVAKTQTDSPTQTPFPLAIPFCFPPSPTMQHCIQQVQQVYFHLWKGHSICSQGE